MSVTWCVSSEGVEFDSEEGCRRCHLAESKRNGVALNAERMCAHCANHVSVIARLPEVSPEVMDRIFSDELPVRRKGRR